MNDLFSGDTNEANFIGIVTAWNGHLMANEKLGEQARNNSEEQFGLGDFAELFTGVVIDAQEAQNSIADQLLKDPRSFGIVQQLVAKMVWQGFQGRAPRSGV